MEVASNIFQVRLPLPSEDCVSSYLFKDKNEWSVIDCGINTKAVTDKWKNTLQDLGLRFSDIGRIYLTHCHPDNFGVAGWMQEMTGASVFAHKNEVALVKQVLKKWRTSIPVVGELFKENGLPPNMISEVLDDMFSTCNFMQPFPKITSLAGNEKIVLGCRHFYVIETPGHSDGHISFFSEEEGLLISGEHLISCGLPYIGQWPTLRQNSLESYLASLEMVGCLPVRQALPAHGPVINDCSAKVDEIIKRYREKLKLIISMLGVGSNAYQLCLKIYGKDINNGIISFVMMDMLAHLAYLETRGRIISRREKGIAIFRCPH